MFLIFSTTPPNQIRKLIQVCFVAFFAFNISAQTSSNKSFKYYSYAHPALPIANPNSYNIRIYAGNNEGINERDLQRNKARKALSTFTKEREYAFSKKLSFTSPEEADILIEIAFDDFQIIKKEFKDTKVGCKRIGAKINSMKSLKQNVKMCDGFYIELTYEFPLVLKISKSDGKILFIKSYNKKGKTTFGYDKTGLTGYLKKEPLDSVYRKTNPKNFAKTALSNQMAEIVPKINTALFFTKVTDEFKIGSGRGGKYDYTELTNIQKKVITSFKKRENISKILREAIDIWEKTILEVNLGDKKARINRKVATAIYGNLALAYLYTYQFEKAEEHVKEHRRLANMAANQEIGRRANRLGRIIQDRKMRYLANSNLSVDNIIPVNDIATQLSNRKLGMKFIEKTNKYDEFMDVISEQERIALEKKKTEQDKNITDKPNSPEKRLEKYRNRITHTSIQGYVLFLNNWYDRDLVNKELPVEICQLTELNELRPYGLKLTAIPKEIGNLTNLVRLDLSGNKLTTIPSSIGNLEKLKVLDLTNNDLTKLPEEIKKLTALRKLKLKGNRFSKQMKSDILSWVPKKCKVKF